MYRFLLYLYIVSIYPQSSVDEPARSSKHVADAAVGGVHSMAWQGTEGKEDQLDCIRCHLVSRQERFWGFFKVSRPTLSECLYENQLGYTYHSQNKGKLLAGQLQMRI